MIHEEIEFDYYGQKGTGTILDKVLVHEHNGTIPKGVSVTNYLVYHKKEKRIITIKPTDIKNILEKDFPEIKLMYPLGTIFQWYSDPDKKYKLTILDPFNVQLTRSDLRGYNQRSRESFYREIQQGLWIEIKNEED